jgi:hypothetical protein
MLHHDLTCHSDGKSRLITQELVKDQSGASGTQIPGYSADRVQHVLKAVLKGVGIEPGPSMKAAAKAGAPPHSVPVSRLRKSQRSQLCDLHVCMQRMTSVPQSS